MAGRTIAVSLISIALASALTGCSSSSEPVPSAESIVETFVSDGFVITEPRDNNDVWCGLGGYVGDCVEFFTTEEVRIVTYASAVDVAEFRSGVVGHTVATPDAAAEYYFASHGNVVLSFAGRETTPEHAAGYLNSLEAFLASTEIPQ